MLSIKLQPFLLLPALLFVFSASFSLSHEAPQHHGIIFFLLSPVSCHNFAWTRLVWYFLHELFHMFTLRFSTTGPRVYENDHGVGSRAIRWHLLEATNSEHEHNSSLILAAERTRRKDPLDGFHYYKGGWNVRERHYFSVGLFLLFFFPPYMTSFSLFLIKLKIL